MMRNQKRPKQKRKKTIMKKQNIVKFALGLAASAVLLVTAADATPNVPIPPTPEGVWAVTRQGVNCENHQNMGPPFTALMTFSKKDGDGTVLAQSYGPFPENAYGGAEMGVWQKGPGPGHSFTFRNLGYSYDDNGQFTSYGIITATGQLTSANTFTYTATIQVYDPNGNLLFTRCGRATATRFE
jgi:hypothetical protein